MPPRRPCLSGAIGWPGTPGWPGGGVTCGWSWPGWGCPGGRAIGGWPGGTPV
ncbi:hypothetical protein [Bosea sp. (in: a-proteobacteria)]|uniref:hypothetical protein n=1 Tax=Bosea sp. (in: a-proteobacteria) TaxID=1871050 RepID=UPI003F702AA7